MEIYPPKTPGSLFGHSINPFVIYSFQKLLKTSQESRYLTIDVLNNKSQDLNDTNSAYLKSSSDTSENFLNSECSSDIVLTSCYNHDVQSKILNDKNDVSYKRFVSALHLDEVRNLLYGTWDAESSEMVWNGVNGLDGDVNSVFDGVQVVTEDDLLRSMKLSNVVLSANHLYDFVKYDVEKQNTNSVERKFELNKKYVLMFGGARLSDETDLRFFTNLCDLKKGSDKFAVSNELYYAIASSFKTNWEFVDSVNSPEPRAFHGSCVVYASLETPVLALCGGLSVNKEALSNDLYLLNLDSENLEWKLMKTNGPLPNKRYGHTLCHVGSHLVVFGGTDGNSLFNDVWTLNINDGKFLVPGSASGNSWHRVEIGGLVPSPRAFHSSCKVGMNSNSPVVVYGGVTNEESFRSRIYALHFTDNDKMLWSILPVYVKSPSESRCFHSMTLVDNKFVISGGFDLKSEKQTNMRSLAYCLESKRFNYNEDSVPLAGHCSWSSFGMVYHWGGLSSQGGNLVFDDSVSVSNPLYYSESASLEELYYKYIQFVTMGTSLEESSMDEDKRKTEVEKSDKDKMAVDNPNVVLKEDDKPQEVSREFKVGVSGLKLLGTLCGSKGNRGEQSSQQLQQKPKDGDSMNVDKPLEPKRVEVSEETKKVEVQPVGGRPRRSAALKSLKAIELDHQKHLEKETAKLESKEQSQPQTQ